jgi:hypothetical protein
MPAFLLVATIALAAVAAIPTAMLGGRESLSMMGLGASVGLAAVLSGFYSVRFALRGPDRFGVNAAVGGFVFRVAMLSLLLAGIAKTTQLPLERFVLWIVFFYFALVMVEAWILAQRSRALGAGASTQESRP